MPRPRLLAAATAAVLCLLPLPRVAAVVGARGAAEEAPPASPQVSPPRAVETSSATDPAPSSRAILPRPASPPDPASANAAPARRAEPRRPLPAAHEEGPPSASDLPSPTSSSSSSSSSSSAATTSLAAYLGSPSAIDPPPDADPEAVAAAAEQAAAYLEQELAILAEFEAAMNAWRDAEAALASAAAAADAETAERETRARADTAEFRAALDREREWQASDPDLEAYAKVACTQTIHHKPVYVPGVFVPPKRAPSVKIPGTPPVFIPGAPAFWEPGRAPFYTPGFWTPGKKPRYVAAVPPTIVPAKKGVVVPGEFTPASYTPGFVIPGWHETTACAAPVCAPPCGDGNAAKPEIIARRAEEREE